MTKWIEVSCTIYKNILVEVEENGDEQKMFDDAYDAASSEYWGVDEMEIGGVFDEKPSDINCCHYDDISEL